MSEVQLSEIRARLQDFNVKRLAVESNILKLQIQVEDNCSVKLSEQLIKERFPEFVVQIVFFVQDLHVKKFKKILGVTSGKGGVGKSIVSLHLAFALREMGYCVGILDADIYTPSIPGLLSVYGAPFSRDGASIEPVKSHGFSLLSMGLFLEYNQSPLWNDTLVDASFRQFLLQGDWQCDYLIIDFAAGLSSLYDTCLQLIPNISMLLVANANKMVYRDVFRMYSFLKGLKFDVKGVVDNMASEPYNMLALPEFHGQNILNLGHIPYFKHYEDLVENGYPLDYCLKEDALYFNDLLSKIID